MLNTYLLSLVLFYSAQNAIDPNLVLAVMKNESNYQVNAMSSTGDVGLLQLNVRSFPGYTIQELLDPETNIKLGTKYLAQLRRQCKMPNDTWIVSFNTGCSKAKTFKYPHLHSYYKKYKRQAAKDNLILH